MLAASDLGTAIQATPELTLSDANHWTVAVFGFALGSGAGLAHQYLQARDDTQTAAVPPYTKQPLAMGAAVNDHAPIVPPVEEAPPVVNGAAGVSIPVPKG